MLSWWLGGRGSKTAVFGKPFGLAQSRESCDLWACVDGVGWL